MLRRIAEIINRSKNFLITSHVRLDGDALGSELALCSVLNGMGKEALVYNQDKTPGNYRFLPGSGGIVNELPDTAKFDVACILDCSDLARIGNQAPLIGGMKNIINIDHHVSRGDFCELSYIDQEASSTGELLYRLILEMGITPTKDVADNLYAAIMTDTGGFRYRNTKEETLKAAAFLVGCGANPQWLSENIYESNPLEKLSLLGEALKTLTFYFNGRAASMVVYLGALARTGALSEHTEGFVDVPRTIKGVNVSILYLELSENNFKLSFRSKGEINVEKVARRFGGGGHRNAAACQIAGELETIKGQVTEALSMII